MSYLKAHPRWWQLYLILPLLIILFAGDSRLKISPRGHQAVQIGIVLAIYVLVHLWLKANAAALSRMDREQTYGSIRVIRVPVSPLPEPDVQNGRILQFPDSEIKGVLSDTFEMDYIDAVSYTVEDVPQESKKE